MEFFWITRWMDRFYKPKDKQKQMSAEFQTLTYHGSGGEKFPNTRLLDRKSSKKRCPSATFIVLKSKTLTNWADWLSYWPNSLTWQPVGLTWKHQSSLVVFKSGGVLNRWLGSYITCFVSVLNTKSSDFWAILFWYRKWCSKFFFHGGTEKNNFNTPWGKKIHEIKSKGCEDGHPSLFAFVSQVNIFHINLVLS